MTTTHETLPPFEIMVDFYNYGSSGEAHARQTDSVFRLSYDDGDSFRYVCTCPSQYSPCAHVAYVEACEHNQPERIGVRTSDSVTMGDVTLHPAACSAGRQTNAVDRLRLTMILANEQVAAEWPRDCSTPRFKAFFRVVGYFATRMRVRGVREGSFEVENESIRLLVPSGFLRELYGVPRRFRVPEVPPCLVCGEYGSHEEGCPSEGARETRSEQ